MTHDHCSERGTEDSRTMYFHILLLQPLCCIYPLAVIGEFECLSHLPLCHDLDSVIGLGENENEMNGVRENGKKQRDSLTMK